MNGASGDVIKRLIGHAAASSNYVASDSGVDMSHQVGVVRLSRPLPQLEGGGSSFARMVLPGRESRHVPSYYRRPALRGGRRVHAV